MSARTNTPPPAAPPLHDELVRALREPAAPFTARQALGWLRAMARQLRQAELPGFKVDVWKPAAWLVEPRRRTALLLRGLGGALLGLLATQVLMALALGPTTVLRSMPKAWATFILGVLVGYVLMQLFHVWRGDVPLRIAPFLAAMCERGLLERDGAAYRFRSTELRDELGGLADAELDSRAREAGGGHRTRPSF